MSWLRRILEKRAVLSGWWRLVFGVVFFTLVSCGDSAETLAPTPNLFKGYDSYPDAALPTHLKSSTPRIFYITDRKPVPTANGFAHYDTRRSHSMAFGVKQIAYGDGLSWNQLKAVSISKSRTKTIRLSVLKSTELVRFPATPLKFSSTANGIRVDPVEKRAYETKTREFQSQIRQELARTGQSEVLIYIHGINNVFTDAAATMANLWHFSGRIALPIVYTWPAGSRGLLGYFSDRESGEFTIFHLKESLRMLAQISSIKNIHIVAHSRGTDVATTALRELFIHERAAGRNPRNTLKIKNLVMAAPDLNFEVARQRLLAERLGPGVGQISVYMNPNDGSLKLVQRLMRGVRLGELTLEDLAAEDLELLAGVKNVNFINVEEVVGKNSHSYFSANPDVVSDIVLVLRTGALPGTKERPLEHAGGPFWDMHPGYPYARPKADDPTEAGAHK